MSSPDDDDLGNVKMVVCLPPASLSRLSNPIDFLLQEEGGVTNTFSTLFVAMIRRISDKGVKVEMVITLVL